MEDRISMSRKDFDRLEILRDVQNKQLRQVDAARMLRITDRQVRNCFVDWSKKGLRGLFRG